MTFTEKIETIRKIIHVLGDAPKPLTVPLLAHLVRRTIPEEDVRDIVGALARLGLIDYEGGEIGAWK